MEISELVLLTDNKRHVHYIREYDALVKTSRQEFQVNIVIEESILRKDIHINFLEDCIYPIIEIKQAIKKEVLRRGL